MDTDFDNIHEIFSWVKTVECKKGKQLRYIFVKICSLFFKKILKRVSKWDKAQDYCDLGLSTYRNILYKKESKDDMKDIAFFKKAIELDKKDRRFYFYIARSYLIVYSDYELALKYFDMALKISSCSEIFACRALTNEMLENYSEAYHNYSKALRMSYILSDMSLYRSSMARIVEIIKENPKNICENKICIRSYPNNPFYYFNLGNIYLNLKKYEKALSYHEKAFSLDHSNIKYSEMVIKSRKFFNAELSNINGKKEFSLGNYDKAWELFDAAVNGNPENPSYLNNLGMVCFKLNCFDEALSNFLRAVSIEETAQRNYNVGRTYFKLKNLTEAVKFYNKAVLIDKKNKQYSLQLHIAENLLNKK